MVYWLVWSNIYSDASLQYKCRLIHFHCVFITRGHRYIVVNTKQSRNEPFDKLDNKDKTPDKIPPKDASWELCSNRTESIDAQFFTNQTLLIIGI